MAHEFLDFFERDVASFAELIAGVDLNVAVPSCPNWQLRDLAVHLGHVYRWAQSCIEENAPLERVEPPVPDSLLVEWFKEGASDLTELLRNSDPQAEIWTFGPHPRMMSFWSRRQAQETSVHLWDARAAHGRPVPISEELAADGVAEVFEVFIPRQLKRGGMNAISPGVRIVLPDGRTFDLGTNVTNQVSGTAGNLLLTLWHRNPVESLNIDGIAGEVKAAFAQALTP